MNNFFCNNFFDLKNFLYKELFLEKENVWEVLPAIESFLERSLLGKIETEIPKYSFLENLEKISIGKNSLIEKGSCIKGPCIIGKNCVIRHGAYIRENTIISDGCIVGHSTEIKNSILLNGAKASHFSYIGDSIVGKDVNLGAKVILANFRLDKKEIVISVKGKKVFTNLKKLGAIVSDKVQIGCSSVLNPGTIIGKGSICYGSLNLKGYIPENSVIKSKNNFVVKKREV